MLSLKEMKYRMIGFVILHYKNIQETQKCVECIAHNFDDYKIVIVENGSANGTDVELRNMYQEENIYIIYKKENIGFSRGNNAGYHYLIENYELDFIVVLNSDIEFGEGVNEPSIKKIYDRTGFHICGPDIVTIEGIHQNPMRQKELTYLDIWIKIGVRIFKIKYYRFLKQFMSNNKDKTIGYMEKKYNTRDKNHLQEQIDKVLHGSFYILSKKFIHENDKVFTPETFLYMEEDILYSRCKMRKYIMVYTPDINVIHKCGGSTDTTATNVIEKKLNKARFSLDSIKIYYNFRKKYKLLD